jgi:hypothetical protein
MAITAQLDNDNRQLFEFRTDFMRQTRIVINLAAFAFRFSPKLNPWAGKRSIKIKAWDGSF